MRRYHYGATAAPAKKVVVVRRPATVTGVATGVVQLAARPVRGAVNTAGNVVKWFGGVLQNLSTRL